MKSFIIARRFMGSTGILVALIAAAQAQAQTQAQTPADPNSSIAAPGQTSAPQSATTAAQDEPIRQQTTQSATAQSPAGSSEQGLGDIVVTASKRSDSSQRVPVTVVAAEGAAIEAKSIKSAADLSKIAPGINFTPVRQSAIPYIRGLGQIVNFPNTDPYISVNLNGGNLPKEISASAFFDVDRVEILYGAQGTLYGRNSLAGVINIYTKRPRFELGGEALFEFGNYHTVNAVGIINIPLTETVAVRAAYSRQRHDSYATSKAGDQNQDDLRVTALYQPNSDTSVLLMGTYTHIGGNGDALINNPPVCGRWCFPVDVRSVGGFMDVNQWMANLTIEHRFSDQLSLTNTAVYNSTKGDSKLVPSAGVPLNPLSQAGAPAIKNYANEFRLTYNSDRVKGILGLYGFHTDGSAVTTVATVATGPLSRVGPFFDHSTGLAAFGEVTYSVTDQLRVIGGLRLSYDKRKLNGTNGAFSAGGTVFTVTQTYQGELENTRVDYRASVQYDLAPRSMLYASFSTGYNGGGFSSAPVTPTSNQAVPFKPVTAKSGIVGMKNRFFNDRVQLNVEGFYNDYRDYQVASRSATTGQNTIFNAQQVRTWGAQVDTRFRLSSSDELGVSAVFLRGKEDKLVLPIAPFSNFSGFELPFAPKVSLHADYRHTFRFATGSTVEFLVDTRYQSKAWGLYNHVAGSNIDSYTMTDASLTYRPASRNWSLAAWVKNIEDTYTVGAVVPGTAPGPVGIIPYPPRTYGVRATARF